VPGYGQPAPGYGPPPGYGANPEEKNVFGVLALVSGIIGILCCGSLLFSGAAIVLGRMNMTAAEQGRATNGGMGKAGFFLGIAGLVVGAVVLVLALTTGSLSATFGS